MQANIFIVGDIGQYEDGDGNKVEGVVLLDVIEQVQKYPNATSYKLNINTCGGSIDEGNKIKEYLLSIGKPINTYGFGMVASMGTLLFLIGEKRELKEGTDFFIHLPQGGVLGDSEQIMEYANEIAEYQKQLLKQYTEATNLTNEAILPLLREETTLTYEQAYNLGFANYKSEAMQPVAYFQKNTNTNINDKMSATNELKMSSEDKSWLESKLEGITNLFKTEKQTPTNVTETTADGETMIDFPDVEEGQPIPLETRGLVDGSPAQGEYVMPSGNTFVFDNGVLTEIREPAAEETMTQEEMNNIIADIKERLNISKTKEEAAKTELATAKKENQTLKQEITNVKSQFETFQAELKTKFSFQSVTNRQEVVPSQQVESEAKKAKQRLIEARKNRR